MKIRCGGGFHKMEHPLCRDGECHRTQEDLWGHVGFLEAEMHLLHSPRAGGEGRKVSTIYLPTYFGLGFKRVF